MNCNIVKEESGNGKHIFKCLQCMACSIKTKRTLDEVHFVCNETMEYYASQLMSFDVHAQASSPGDCGGCGQPKTIIETFTSIVMGWFTPDEES